VTALEAGDYASLPSPAVVRGFVRAYAKILKLDAAPLVAMIEMDTPMPAESGAGTVRRDKPASFSEVRFPSHGKRTSLPLGWIAGAVVVIAAAAAAWHFGVIPTGQHAETAAPGATTVLPPPVAGSAASAPGASASAPEVLQSTSVPLISVPAADSSTGAAAPAGATSGAAAASAPAAAAPVAAAAQPAAAGGANALVLNVREDSWIEVRGAKGAPRIARLVKGGSTETIDVTEPMTLVVGKPAAVSATLRGAAVALPPVPGKTISRVSLK
jgi:cytoskeleton protein RodZ